MPDRFEDERGVIQDLLDGPIDSVTRIFTRQGAIRGNHIHEHTTQWVYVVSGELLVAEGTEHRLHGDGDFFEERKGLPHAWKAMSDCTVLVITRGPRSGQNYEMDTRRLDVPLL